MKYFMTLLYLQTYDALNRESFRYLPVNANTSGGGYMQPYVVGNIAQAATYYGKDTSPCSYPVYENSSLNRIKQQFGPGKDWEEHPVQTLFLTNQNRKGLAPYQTFYPKFSVRIYSLSADSLTYKQDYATGTLDCTQIIDEDGHNSMEFKDRATDRILLSRVMDGEVMHDTYYVYDNYGNLRMVLPPAASDLLTAATTPASWIETTATIQKYAYIYKYDGRNRCIYKKLPGCDPVYTVYDAADRPIFVQDAEQRTKGEWSFSIPDVFGRIVLTGTCKNSLPYTADPYKDIVIKATRLKGANQTNDLKGYTLPQQVTLIAPAVLSVNYYDQYNFIGSNGIPSGLTTTYEKVSGYDQLRTAGVKGLLTGTLTAKMNSSGAVSGYLYSVLYYDERGRVIQQRGNNSLAGEEKVFTAYDFPGNPTQVRKVHTVGADTRTEVYVHTYDPAERPLKTTYQLDNAAAVTLVNNTYDEVGRLKSDSRNGNAKLKTEYAYNIRSWTKSITGTLFSQTLNYQEAITGNTPCYNGNISGMSWKAGAETAQRGYRFTYDALSRLKDALYGEGATLAANTNRFNEQITGYDKMGNILKLKRYGQTSATAYGLIDDLTLTYNGNQLQAVKDAATSSVYGNGTEFKDGSNQVAEYTYNKNGNLIKDLNKNISNIGYNLLNLPNQVTFAGGNSVLYEYAADGTKLRTVHKTGATTLTTDYCGNAVYENGVLKMLLNEAGYVSFPDRKFHFYLKDHQGNVRVTADKDGNVEETNNYYPFGGTFTSTASVQPYKYNGKELDVKNGLNWYDYGARHYDAAIGRWQGVDPMSEKYYSSSPYNYCDNDPVSKIDPDGNQSRPTRPPVRRGYKNGGRYNPYAFYPRGVKPQSYREETSVSYRGNTGRKLVIMESPTILHTVNTPGGNQVQMSGNNKWGIGFSGMLDLYDSYKEFKDKLFSLHTTVSYTDDGTKREKTEIVLNDPRLVSMQLDYEKKAREIDKSLGELDFKGKSMIEILKMCIERRDMIRKKIGFSPKELIETKFYTEPEEFEYGAHFREDIPEFNQN